MRSLSRVSVPKIVQISLLAVMLALSMVIPASSAEAKSVPQEDSLAGVYTLDDFDYQTDINFQGVAEERTFGITFPQNWAFDSPATLKVHFSHSTFLDPSSSMSVDWNGQRIGAILLTEDNAQEGILELSIPPEKLNLGYNALKVSFFMGVSTYFCNDYNNPGVWAVIHNDTSVEVSPQVVPRQTDLTQAPDILVDSSLLAENRLTLIVADSPSVQHLNALAVMTTKLGQLAGWRNISIEVMTISEAKQAQPSGNLVLLATADEINELSPLLIPEITSVFDLYNGNDPNRSPLAGEDGLVSLQISPFDVRYHILSLTGQTAAAVEKSARSAAFDELFEQANGNWAVVRELPEVTEQVTDPLTVSMAELGYQNQSVSGTQEQTIQYSLPISALWNVDSEAWLDLHFSHSEMINRDQSTVSVLVNGIPIASFELASDNADDGYKEIRIPLRYLEVGENIISLKVKMTFSDEAMAMEESCSLDTTPRAWFIASSDTTIRFPNVSQQTPLNLSNFPYGFVEPFTFKGFAFGMPATTDSVGLNALANIAVAIGKATLGNPASIDLLPLGEDLSPFNEYSHVFLLGTIDTMVTESLNTYLPVPLDVGTGLPQSDNTLLILETAAGTRAYLQTFKDDEANIYLVLAADDVQGMAVAGELLGDPGARYAVDGNVAVVTAPDNASSYQVQASEKSVEQQPQTINEDPFTALTGQSVWVLRVSIGIGVISVIVLLVALFRKNPSDRES